MTKRTTRRDPAPKPIAGSMEDDNEISWTPLRNHVGMFLADWFMYMYGVRLADGTWLHAYKHIDTRRYFHLHDDGRVFVYTDDDMYLEVLPQHGFMDVFDEWWRYCPEQDQQLFEAALRVAFHVAWRRSSTSATFEPSDDDPAERAA